MSGANGIAHFLADTGDIKRDGQVQHISELKTKNLEVSDQLANSVHNWAIGIAATEGGGSGAAGVIGLAVDIPAVIVLALRTVHKIGLCYGYDCSSDLDQQFILGILSASGANSMKEKSGALTALRSIEVILARETWKSIGAKAAKQQMSKEGGIIALRSLAKQLGIHLTKRKALQAIPVIGAVVGASVNGWFIQETGWAARRVFQERWLIENQKIGEI